MGGTSNAMLSTVMQISNWSLVVLLFIGVPINLLSLWLLVQKMFNFGAGGWGGGLSGSDSRSLFYRLKCFSTKILGSRNNRRRSFTDSAYFASKSASKRPKQKPKRSMIHCLLLVLCVFDLCVIIMLVALFSLPHIWPLFGKKWVYMAPYLIPFTQIVLLISEYATVLISLERYVRIVYVCNLRICRFFNEDNFKYYMVLLLIGPPVFFLPKFYEYRTVHKLYKFPKSFNCSEYWNEAMQGQPEFLEITENLTSPYINGEIGNIFNEHNPTEQVCNKSLAFLNLSVESKVPLPSNNVTDKCGPPFDVISSEEMKLEDSVALNMDYNTQTKIARVCKRVIIPMIDRTELRKNPLYYKIYILSLTTLFAQIIPMGILIYLNIKICLALSTPTDDQMNIAIRNQRKNKTCAKRERQNKTKSVDELEKNPNTGTPPNSRGCIRKRSRSLKYHKSQSLDEENFKVHELETTLSSPRIADEQKHENHILCLSRQKEALRLANGKKFPSGLVTGNDKKQYTVSSCNVSITTERTRVRQLRPFDPMFRSVHLENEPITVIIDYVESPSEEDSIKYSPIHDSYNLSKGGDEEIFTVSSERLPCMLKTNGYEMKTTGVSNSPMPLCGKCSKSTSPDLCEKTKFSAIKGIENGNKTQNMKCNSSAKNAKLDEHQNDKKSSGCHWTCGTKMFSKSEKSMTRASIAIVWLFIFCHIWRMVPNIYEAIYPESPDNPHQSPMWLHYFTMASHALIVFNSSINFLIYLF